MPIADKVLKYSVYVAHNDFVDFQREIGLSLESGSSATLVFPQVPPNDWLQFSGADITLYMAQDEFADVYHILQTESPVFFTALNFWGIRVGAVHTELDLSAGEVPGQGEERVPRSIRELIRRAKRENAAT